MTWYLRQKIKPEKGMKTQPKIYCSMESSTSSSRAQ